MEQDSCGDTMATLDYLGPKGALLAAQPGL